MAPAMREEWNERAKADALHFIDSAAEYDSLEAFFTEGAEMADVILHPVLDAYVEDAEVATALDVGCGIGRFATVLNDEFGRVHAVDVSDEMVRTAREVHEGSGIEFHATDGESLDPIPDGSIDFAFSYVVFQHMPDVEVVERNVAALSRTMSVGGIAQIHFKTVHGWMHPFGVPVPNRLVQRLPSEVRGLYHRLKDRDELVESSTWSGVALSTSEIAELFETNGFRVIEFRDDPTHATDTRTFCIAEKVGD